MKSRAFVMRPVLILLTTIAWTFIGPAVDTLAKSHMVKEELVVKVGVYNYAGVGRLQLRVAERQAAALLSEANVRIAWSEYSGRRLSVPIGKPAPDFSVRILKASRILRARRISGADALGQSIMAPGTHWNVPGRIANIFYDRVEHVASLWGFFPRDVLGDVVAHELGHLLLGPRHSHRGIMKADWKPQDLAFSSRCKLRFSPKQAAAIQRTARLLQRTAPVTSLIACASPPATLGRRVGAGTVFKPCGASRTEHEKLNGEEAHYYESLNE